MKITVNVTANDIKYGKPMDGYACPIHRSLARHKAFKDLNSFCVGRRNVIAHGNNYEVAGERYLATLPEAARLFTKEFDGLYGKAVKKLVRPFTFELEVYL